MEGGFRVLETAPLEAGQTALQPTDLVQATRHGRVIYPLFSREIQRIGRAHKARTRSEYLALKAELKEAKIKYKSTRQAADKAVVDGLYKQLDALQVLAQYLSTMKRLILCCCCFWEKKGKATAVQEGVSRAQTDGACRVSHIEEETGGRLGEEPDRKHRKR